MSAIAQTRFEIVRSLGKRRKGGFRYGPEQNQDWRSIAKQASTEMDSAKLTTLVAELCRSLDERQNASVSAPRVTNPAN
jgi:hypothetical protein